MNRAGAGWSKRTWLHWQRYVTAVLVAMLVLAQIPAAAFAQSAEPDAGAGRLNDNVLEFGVWWVEDYPPAGPGGADLPATRPDALGLRDMLTSTCKFRFLGVCFQNWSTPTWTARFVYGNSNAWASDWRRSQNGGSENFYIDTVDLAYFAGHGSRNGIIMGANSPTPRTVTKNDGLNAWGDRDLDWIAWAACNLLDDPVSNLAEWGQTMNGLRLILGFRTVMNDVAHGVEFGRYLRDDYTLMQAWFKAADKLQSQGRVARVLAERQAYFNDRWSQHNAFTPAPDWPKWYITHPVGSEPARPVEIAQINGQMPVLPVQPLDLEQGEDINRWNALGNAFGVDVTLPETEDEVQAEALRAALQETQVYFSEDGQMEMDRTFGLFLHADKDELYMMPDEAESAAGQAMLAIDQDAALQVATTFLTNNNLLPIDAQFFEVAGGTLTRLDQVSTQDGEVTVQATEQARLNHQVIFSRIITYEVAAPIITGVDGSAQSTDVEFSVMGPGSKLKIYVATEVPVAEGLTVASLLQNPGEAVQGGMGGYRSIMSPEVQMQTTGAVQMVDVLPFEVIEKLFDSEELEPIVSLDHVPLAPTQILEREIISNTLAYWEGPIGFEQGELIPVHALTIRNLLEGIGDEANYETESTTYIPVDPSYMSPLAHITTTVDLNLPVAAGQTLQFEALDASLPLNELGFDPNPDDGFPLDFALGSGNPIGYAYSWYLNEVDEENRLTNDTEGVTLSNGNRSLELTLRPFVNLKDGTLTGNQRLILEVVDTDNGDSTNTSYAELSLQVVPPTYIPSLSADE